MAAISRHPYDVFALKTWTPAMIVLQDFQDVVDSAGLRVVQLTTIAVDRDPLKLGTNTPLVLGFSVFVVTLN
jgi:hypothetical protein